MQIAEDLLRERGGGRRDRRRRLADRRFDPHLASSRDGVAEQPLQERACRAGLGGVAHLAEDLALTRDERVESGRDAEEVQRGRVVVKPVGDLAELGRLLDEHVEGLPFALLVLADDIELGAVAGREHDRLAVRRQPLRQLARPLEVERDALPQLDRGLAVRDADERELHEAKWVIGRTSATRAKAATVTRAARPPRRRDSWRNSSRAA